MSKYNNKEKFDPKDADSDDKKGHRKSNFSKSRNRRGSRDNKRSRSEKTDVTTGEPFREFKTTVKGANDASWYAKNPQLLVDSASFSFNTALGSRIGWDFDIVNSVGTGLSLNPNFEGLLSTLPGIMSLHYANYPGISTDRSSPINIASENIYSFVRHTNSGHANYDQSDLMMYLIAMDSLYSFIAFCRRIYGTARIFNQKNYYYQKSLTRMQGVDYDDLIANLSDFRAYINTLSAKASAFAVPSSMPIMQRHFFMASNIYKDRDTEKSQLYVFEPVGFHMYNETPGVIAPYNDAGGCEFIPLSVWNQATPQTMKVSDLIQYGNNLIAALLQSEDIGIMSGDILKAFQGNIFTIPATPEDYVVMPVYDPEVLSQIQNAIVGPRTLYNYISRNYNAKWHALDVLQDPNTSTIVADFTAATGIPMTSWSDSGDMLVTGSRLMTFNFDHPTPADVMVGSRLMQNWSLDLKGYTGGGTDPQEWTCESVGTEVVLQMYVCVLTANGLTSIKEIFPWKAWGGGSIGDTIVQNLILVSNFHCHPTMMYGALNIGSNLITLSPMGIMGDVDTYRMLSGEDLKKLNQTALLSLYGVPALGTY